MNPLSAILAQLEELSPCKRLVAGSTPADGCSQIGGDPVRHREIVLPAVRRDFFAVVTRAAGVFFGSRTNA